MKPTLSEYVQSKLANTWLKRQYDWKSTNTTPIEPTSPHWRANEPKATFNTRRETSQLRKRGWVEMQTGLSRSAIYDRLDPKSPRYDRSFPQPVKIGARAVAWFEHEVYAWMASLKPFRTGSDS